MKSIKYECLNHFVFFGERHLRYVIKEDMSHYMAERFHQGLDGNLVVATTSSANENKAASVITYHRDAA